MKKSPAEPTTAKNLEQKFDQGEEVLDYFDVRKAQVVKPQARSSMGKAKSSYEAKRDSECRAVVREKSARYRTRK